MKLYMLARTHFSSHKHKSQTPSLMGTLVPLLPNLKTPLTIQISHMQPRRAIQCQMAKNTSTGAAE